ncbi:peptidyl-prolyl cis-trans isomerase FKBP1B isoform X3 [Panthera tigris]|uniref:peptidyl-prolyl cis-trans isomerase FKBP1B isoform X3 n=1 Tax=Panthera tigris TaxID=9694 RepID=UPI001C6F9E3F|nr:peptidyl-prolyl cis-trans isomerase FKBP1B isoform X3 [Panthera tigris]
MAFTSTCLLPIEMTPPLRNAAMTFMCSVTENKDSRVLRIWSPERIPEVSAPRPLIGINHAVTNCVPTRHKFRSLTTWILPQFNCHQQGAVLCLERKDIPQEGTDVCGALHRNRLFNSACCY